MTEDRVTDLWGGSRTVEWVAIQAGRTQGVELPEIVPGEPVEWVYTNWEGNTRLRRILPLGIRWGATEWHPEPQWLLKAWDCDKGVEREFALAGFKGPAN